MFVLVLALNKYGWTASLGALLSRPTTVGGTVASFGVSSFLAANLVNNIPMSVLYSSVVSGMTGGTLTTAALYASVIGSNLGAFFTPTGALAGIMWTGQLHDHGVPFSFTRFVRYGATVAVPALAAALLGLWLVA
jgi:arsenical pump membrane protein